MAIDTESGERQPLLAEFPTGGTYEDISIMATDDAGDDFITDLPTIDIDEWEVENEILKLNVRGVIVEVDFRDLYQDIVDFANYGHIEESDGIYFVDDAWAGGAVVVRRNGYLYPIVWQDGERWRPYELSEISDDTAFCLVANGQPVLYENDTFYWVTNANLEVNEDIAMTEEEINAALREVVDFDNSDIKGVILVDEWDGDGMINVRGAIPFMYCKT